MAFLASLAQHLLSKREVLGSNPTGGCAQSSLNMCDLSSWCTYLLRTLACGCGKWELQWGKALRGTFKKKFPYAHKHFWVIGGFMSQKIKKGSEAARADNSADPRLAWKKKVFNQDHYF